MTQKQMTAPITSVGADAGQSKELRCINSIPNLADDFNSLGANFDETPSGCFEEMQREMYCRMDPSYLKTVTMANLYDAVFDVQASIIDGLLYQGTYLFAGSPKVGKSFLMTQIAYHVSTGTPLWNYKVRKATVLYFALEDNYSRLQRRLFRMFGAEETDNLYFATQCKTVNGGLEDQIQGFMQEHPDTGLIIIDTLKRVRETGGADYSYSSDYDIVATLKSIADNYKVTMLIVHHTRKHKTDDPYDMISGTNGLLGAADGAFILSKEKRTANTAALNITGRDQQDQKLNLTRDETKLTWNLESVETELWKQPPDPLLERIADVLYPQSNNRWDGTASDLSEILGLDIKPNVLSLRLSINAERLFQDYGIHYKTSRTHKGRSISLWKEEAACVSMRDDRDKLFESDTVV